MKHFKDHVDVTDEESFNKAIRSLFCLFKPEWKKNDVHIENLTGGTTNRIVLGWHADPRDKILLRVYGLGSEILIDRRQEIENMELLSNAGLGSHLLGVFSNGICYQYLPGHHITREMVASKEVFPLIARKMAKMHLIQTKKENILWERMETYIKLSPESFKDPQQDILFKAKFVGKQLLTHEFCVLKSMLENCSSPLVFCHNDLNIPNIIHDGSDVAFIDVEYAGCSYAAFDIANHFVEFTGCDVEDLDYVRFYPHKELQIKWIQEYLMVYKGSCNSAEVEEYYALVQKFTLCSHLFWIAWALIQAKVSTIDYDFLGAAIKRLEEYKRMKLLTLKTSQIG